MEHGSPKNQMLVERLLDDLHRLMWLMVWDVANNERWQLEPEEVYAELCLELVALVDRYHDKAYDELKRISVTSLRNRIYDLASACYLTNRKHEAGVLSIDYTPDDQDSDTLEETTEVTSQLPFSMDEFCDGMSEDARTLVNEVLFPSERTAHFLKLTAQRKRTVSPKGYWTLTITPLIMARSLGWPMKRLQAAWKEISNVISGNNHFDGGLVA